ncbi:TPA: glycosyltransferase family 32 protein [Streptococcus suis]|nr:glycosyl transferase [Streptococcus sp.]MCO4464664.1 Polysaccharide biosynthesis protein CpsM(V) [Streptococcus infantarius subsp. infantarius]MCO4629299.1 Polysaccharide biosynthesis protein CpsM(V) [Streptococcus infantarius subsp. infantarius]
MIPKKIHYCWFGGNPLPESVKKCKESWKKFCPDYEIIEWNESNYNVHKMPFISDAYTAKKYAFVSDYARLDIIYNEGGIYLDTDVELIRPLDALLSHSAFMGMELIGEVNTGLGFGAEKYHRFIGENRDVYLKETFNTSNLVTCVELTTNLLVTKGLEKNNSIQIIDGVTIYPMEYFCPYNMETRKTSLTENTYSIHHYDATWYGSGLKAIVRKKLLPIKIYFKKILNTIFGEGSYQKVKEFLKGK